MVSCCSHLHSQVLLYCSLTTHPGASVLTNADHRGEHMLTFFNGSARLWTQLSRLTHALGYCKSFQIFLLLLITIFPLPRIVPLTSCPSCQLLQENKHGPSCSLENTGAPASSSQGGRQLLLPLRSGDMVLLQDRSLLAWSSALFCTGNPVRLAEYFRLTCQKKQTNSLVIKINIMFLKYPLEPVIVAYDYNPNT